MKKALILNLIFFLFLSNIFGQYNSVLAHGNWYKISTNKTGIYKLSYSDLESWGMELNNLQTSAIKLYGNGGGMLPRLNSDFRYDDLVENAIKIHDSNSNGIFEIGDYLLFYGQSPHIWRYNDIEDIFYHTTHLFTDEVNYFITIDTQSQGKRIELGSILQNSTRIITSFNAFSFHESESENLIQSGKEWFGERFDIQHNQSFNFSFPNLDQSIPVNIKTAVVARSLVPSVFTVSANGTTLNTISVNNIVPDYATEYAKIASKTINYNASSSEITINVDYSSADNGALAWLNYIEINARRELKMSGSSLLFRDASSISNEVGTFKISDANLSTTIWDVSNAPSITELSTTFNDGELSFNDSINKLHEYIAFNGNSYLSPIFKGNVSNQNLHNIASDIEYVIVSHPNFLSAAERLARFHENRDNLRSVIVTTTQIFNEFSSGVQDVSAIRDFLRMLYKRPDSKLKYVLLFGDGSYDPKNRILNNTNYIPTYQSENSTHPTLSYVTDDYFGLLDEDEGLFSNDLVDIGVGRFPASTLMEANILVDKVEQYYKPSSFGNWRNDIAFIADDGDSKDGNTHMWQADSLANHIADNYKEINIQKIYLDNYEQESTPAGPRSEITQNVINNKVNKGALLVNYTGHGGPLGWTQERILEIDQIQEWDNLDNLPLFFTATCKFSCFDNPAATSAGEYVLLNPKGGAIALFSTTRLVYSPPNYYLNTKFIKTIFEQQNEEFEFPRLGDIFKITKVLSGTSSNNRNFTLLGDPALSLTHPQYDVITTFMKDTLKALEEVVIEGKIEDNGMLLSDFNGTIYATVFDKEIIRTTLGQESCTPMPYRDQNNILYKGSATVKDGSFSFSFIVPKDIAYNYGVGKISYYAINGDESHPSDANGSEDNFVIGGTGDDIIYDYDGADLSLFMNDRLFKEGGITDKNPILIADVFDLSGINTVGNGIGHDITAVLDGNTTSPYVLNDFYEAKKDDFTRGVIRFPLYNLEKGEHTIRLKLWDVFNNSSEETISFVVTDNNEFIIADFTTYPNPFSISTDIYFQHNKSSKELDYILEIYSIRGSLVKRIEESDYNSTGYRIGPITWDGKNEYGREMSAGIYIARLRVSTSDDEFTSKSIRIILLPQ